METAYVINLKHRTDRWEKMRTKWGSFFNLIRVDGIILPKDSRLNKFRASEGLGLTHISLIEQTHSPTLLILEDDAVPTPNFMKRWTEIKNYLDTHLTEWEVFNGGVHFLKHYHSVKQLNKSVLIDGQIGCAGHFLYLNMTAKPVFREWLNDKLDIDMFYCNQKLLCSYPLLAKQEDDRSDIIEEERSWDYTYKMNELSFYKHLKRIYTQYKYIV